MAFHDLTSLIAPPPNLRSLLGLGLKFIPTPYRTTTFSQLHRAGDGFSHLDRALRLRCFFVGTGATSNTDYNPKMRIPSNWDPPPGYYPKVLENRFLQFEIAMKKLFRPATRSISNLARHHRHALEYLRHQKDFIVANCDKNLGPAIIERDRYVELAIEHHLSDATTYQRLLPLQAAEASNDNHARLIDWLARHRVELSDDEYKYLSYHRSIALHDPLPYFYLLMKVHKEELATRPIVSFPGSMFYALGVWIDFHLQPVAKSFPTYLTSSFELKKNLETLVIPPNCRLFTADATSMYTNIDTDAAIQAIHDYILHNQAQFPLLPLTPLIEALILLMKHNVFQFGDTFWKQLIGTAMGANPAPTYANIAFGTHELQMLPQYRARLPYYKRYIDDVFGLWLKHPDSTMDDRLWLRFKRRLNGWHGLKWKISERTDTVVFLDLTLTLRDSQINCTLFEKPLNLHLHLPPHSAHPPGVLFGFIAGFIYRARTLCTLLEDSNRFINEYLTHLRSRGYAASVLRPLFIKALQLLASPPPAPVSDTVNPDEPPGSWFFKLPYHPQDPAAHLIQRAWKSTVATPPLSKPLASIDIKYRKLGDRRFIVCYRRPPNLGNLLSYRKLKPDSGPPVSSFL
jgi:hypothetical protein